MANTKPRSGAATTTEFKPFRIPLVGTSQSRDGSTDKDQRLLNCFPESKKNEITETKKSFTVKRPGLATRTTYSSGTGRGCFRWNGADYVAIGAAVYKDAVSHQTITGTSGHVGFVVINDNYVEKLFFCDGTNAFVTDGTTVTQIPISLSAWVTLTAYSVGARRIPTVTNGFYYEVTVAGTTGGTEPVWPTIEGDLIVDGTVTWQCAGYYGFSYNVWSQPRTPTVGARIVPTTANTFFYECTVSGAVAATEPLWPLVIDDTVTDGGATWKCIGKVDTIDPMPKSHLPYPVYLDETVFLAAKDAAGNASQSIYSSGVRNPHSWNQVDFINAQQYPDVLSAIVRHHNYIAAFGLESLEFFYDAANASGSPLSRNESFTVRLGCPAPETIQQTERLLIFVGTSSIGNYAVYHVDNFTPKRISDPYIERILAANVTEIAGARAYYARISGHLFYVLRLTSRTLVFDIDEKLWHEWTSNSSGSHVTFTGAYSADTGSGGSMILGATDGVLSNLSASTYTDNGTTILMDIYTANQDMDTINRKFLHQLTVVGDAITGSSIDVRWSDDDFVTWTSYITVDMSAIPARLFQLGAFRRRAFHLRHSSNTAQRLEALELNASLGIS